jgi:uncharacterized protein YgiB involved in biofilm formation
MPRGARKRSLHVSLVLLGAAALAGCGETDKRDVYANQADCVQDWGEQTQCEPVRDGNYHSSYYYGPHYNDSLWNRWWLFHRSGQTVAPLHRSSHAIGSHSHAVATHSVSRGGFGAHASAHSSGG